MAFRRKSYRRKTFKRRTYRKKRYTRSRVNAPKTYKISWNSDSYFGSGAGGAMSQQIATMDPTLCTEWTSVSALYDQYKVTCVKIQYYPNFIDSAVPVNSGLGIFKPLYVVYDADSTTGPTTTDIALQYGTCKVKNMYRPWKYVIRPRVQTDNSVNNAGMALTFSRNGPILDVASAAYYQKGIIAWYGTGYPVSSQFGHIIVDYYVKFFGRR